MAMTPAERKRKQRSNPEGHAKSIATNRRYDASEKGRAKRERYDASAARVAVRYRHYHYGGGREQESIRGAERTIQRYTLKLEAMKNGD